MLGSEIGFDLRAQPKVWPACHGFSVRFFGICSTLEMPESSRSASGQRLQVLRNHQYLAWPSVSI